MVRIKYNFILERETIVPLLHKCISLYLDTETIGHIIQAAKQMEPPLAEQ